ncbi:hypothetical protein ACM66B_002587 [Microbotryomycetes sp. NB124-2]
MKAGSFKPPNRRQALPGGRVLQTDDDGPRTLGRASTQATTTSRNPAPSRSSGMPRSQAKEEPIQQGSGRFPSATASNLPPGRQRSRSGGFALPSFDSEKREQALDKARSLGLRRAKTRTPSPVSALSSGSESERETKSSWGARRQSTATAGATWSRKSSFAHETSSSDRSPPRTPARNRRLSKPATATEAARPSSQAAAPALATPQPKEEAASTSLFGAVWAKASQVLSAARGGVSGEDVPDKTLQSVVAPLHLEADEKLDKETEALTLQRPVSMPPSASDTAAILVAGSLLQKANSEPRRAPIHQHTNVAPAVPSGAAATRSILFHRPPQLHPREIFETTTRTKTKAGGFPMQRERTPFDWLESRDASPLDAFLFHRMPGRAQTRRPKVTQRATMPSNLPAMQTLPVAAPPAPVMRPAQPPYAIQAPHFLQQSFNHVAPVSLAPPAPPTFASPPLPLAQASYGPMAPVMHAPTSYPLRAQTNMAPAPSSFSVTPSPPVPIPPVPVAPSGHPNVTPLFVSSAPMMNPPMPPAMPLPPQHHQPIAPTPPIDPPALALAAAAPAPVASPPTLASVSALPAPPVVASPPVPSSNRSAASPPPLVPVASRPSSSLQAVVAPVVTAQALEPIVNAAVPEAPSGAEPGEEAAAETAPDPAQNFAASESDPATVLSRVSIELVESTLNETTPVAESTEVEQDALSQEETPRPSSPPKLSLDWHLPELGLSVASPIAIESKTLFTELGLGKQESKLFEQKTEGALPLPELDPELAHDEFESEDESPDSPSKLALDEAFAATTSFVTNFKEEQVLPVADRNHDSRMRKWLSQQGVEPVVGVADLSVRSDKSDPSCSSSPPPPPSSRPRTAPPSSLGSQATATTSLSAPMPMTTRLAIISSLDTMTEEETGSGAVSPTGAAIEEDSPSSAVASLSRKRVTNTERPSLVFGGTVVAEQGPTSVKKVAVKPVFASATTVLASDTAVKRESSEPAQKSPTSPKLEIDAIFAGW